MWQCYICIDSVEGGGELRGKAGTNDAPSLGLSNKSLSQMPGISMDARACQEQHLIGTLYFNTFKIEKTARKVSAWSMIILN